MEKSLDDHELEASPERRNSHSWTQKEEDGARHKVDTTVLPLLFLGLLVFQLDRMNLASALTAGFATDIGVSQATINLGNQLMFLFIVVFEIPCNMLLQKIGPRKWISGQVICFGLVATLQVFVRNRTGFLVSRSFLGLAESAYIPGAVYTLSTWYRQRELARRVAIFFFGMFSGNALSPILASGIIQLDGRQGLSGWQWIFLIEGVFTISVGLSLLFILPGSPNSPTPLLSRGLIRISPTDQHILQQRLLSEGNSETSSRGLQIPWALVRKTLLHYKRWPHYLSTSLVFSTWSPLTTYTPSIYLSLGFSRVSANALATVGAAATLPVAFLFAWLSDRTNLRGGAVIAAQTCYLAALIAARAAQDHVAGPWGRWALWTVVNAFAVGYHPVHNTWVQVNCVDPRERSIAVAMWVMFAIGGLMYGSQYFQGGDRPFYRSGLRTMIILVASGIALALVQEVVYWLHNRKVRNGTARVLEGEEKPRVYVL
ncbi:inner membrane transport protein yfav [Diaporthe amygdali]|uniref:inner membrane transport protein yfav n=1 Tax=Phomopsis amygdali TaxID=1214568 RepID=UPI0022FE40D3|nr:inner membrane transport protein yfav [Diaporthe amygdali]KAJ0106882.1 inner membrane transport protein yfav [Diaporthe amygdali]